MAHTYTVKKGDTLSEIALANISIIRNSAGNQSLTTYQATDKLADWNDISNPNFIYVGEVLTLEDPGTSGTKSTANTTNKPTISKFGIQANSSNTIFATWLWDKTNTENYEYIWYYATGDGLWFVGTKSTSEFKQCTWSVPDNATKVKFKVKAISKTYTVNNKETSYWTGDWSNEKIWLKTDAPPKKPGVPSVTLNGYKLTAELDNIDADINAEYIYFEVVKNDTSAFVSGKSRIITRHASYSVTLPAGNEYKVHCRSMRGDLKSDWSDYSENVTGYPAIPTLTTLKGESSTSVYLKWSSIATAESYEIEYTEKLNYFDSSNATTTQSVPDKKNYYTLIGLETGKEYYFRVRAINASGNSGWSTSKSVILGKKPAPPTTWSSSTTVITGEPLTLYWVHNSQDGSSQVGAHLSLNINGDVVDIAVNNDRPEDEKDKTSSYTIDTSPYVEGTTIKWKVCTEGVTLEPSDWSVERVVDIYAPPTMDFTVNGSDGQPLETLTAFPFVVFALIQPDTQKAVTLSVSVTTNEAYETMDNVGNTKIVNKGDEVYSKVWDVSKIDDLVLIFRAGDIALQNNITYTLTGTAAMDSGLSVSGSQEFKVAWDDEEYTPDAEISLNEENMTVSIRPYVIDETGEQPDDVYLSVYRREYNGKFTAIAENLKNRSNTFVTDPHPALDYARYRIVATGKKTGSMVFYDTPGYPVNGKSVIIQWDEQWSSFDTTEESSLERPNWTGSLLKLPYNIDVTEKAKPDVELVQYIGRSNPVSYYGTQEGITAEWAMVIDATDIETLYALRRLAIYKGDVYVREPSGMGYWAQVEVSMSKKHCELTIPVTMSITRVEGGL